MLQFQLVTNCAGGVWLPRERLPFFNKSRVTSEDVDRHVIRAVKRNKLYVITQTDGKFSWFCKRMTPEIYFKVLGRIYKHGLGERYLGIPKTA